VIWRDLGTNVHTNEDETVIKASSFADLTNCVNFKFAVDKLSDVEIIHEDYTEPINNIFIYN
jgi:hypothetical protein